MQAPFDHYSQMYSRKKLCLGQLAENSAEHNRKQGNRSQNRQTELSATNYSNAVKSKAIFSILIYSFICYLLVIGKNASRWYSSTNGDVLIVTVRAEKKKKKSNGVTAACYCIVILANYFTICSLIISFSQVPLLSIYRCSTFKAH